ncbi:MAG: glycosyltransferase family 2 protein [Gammaproteobacteria bacterium]|nr:MAG: glycosyltransferase family 2 protein [Gammaproteobacteria bacterium]
MSILVSVVIPNYNTKPEYLERCITSAINQTVSGIEVITVDDGSLVPFSGMDDRIQDERLVWIRNRRNRGVSVCRNIGIEKARGEWIAFLDADDWWLPEKLERQLEKASESNVNWVYCSSRIYERSGSYPISHAVAQYAGNVLEPLLKEQIITGSASSVLVRRDTAVEVGRFDSDVVEDWDYWIRLAKRNPVDYVVEELVCLRDSGKSGRSAQLQERIDRVSALFEKHWSEYQRFGLERYAKAHLGYVAARQHFIAGHYLTSFREMVVSFLQYPPYFKAKRILKWICSSARALRD